MTKVVITNPAGPTELFKSGLREQVEKIRTEGYEPRDQNSDSLEMWLEDVLEEGYGMEITFFKKFTSEFWTLTTDILSDGTARAEFIFE